MGPPESEDDAKRKGLRPEPLCLFCFPDEGPSPGGRTYVNPVLQARVEERTSAESFRRQREKEEFWLRKRTEARIRRRRAKEPIRSLKAYLLSSVRNEHSRGKANLPTLFEVLQTVKDAWPSPPSRSRAFLRNDKQSPKQPDSGGRKQPEMKNEPIRVQFPCQLLSRRLSVPEELMRRYSVTAEKTSEESETKTAVDISPSSSRVETARRKDAEGAKGNSERPKAGASGCRETSESEGKVRAEYPQRVSQSDYYREGKRIIRVRGGERCTCRREQSSTTVSAKEETDDSATTESLLSSSPTQLPKRESSSGNLSSESDNLRCTCAELSSKETSTDPYLSGKSTLSQTVSDKSMSTQDSTVSVNSVSSRGSTVSDDSNSTTPEVERTSAKETTTSPDCSPRTPRNRKSRRREKYLGHLATCPRYDASHASRCPVHSPPRQPPPTANAATNTDPTEAAEGVGGDARGQEEPYRWAKLSEEELYMMQQLRHRKFVERRRELTSGAPAPPEGGSGCGEAEGEEQAILIPRYSALPRSLSMLVNTSSPDSSHNSDSDNQSLADSLEDQPVTHVHRLYFDTKKESKPVRGDATFLEESRLKHRQPRGRAFFVSIKDPFGEDEMLENIEKIPQPPEKIRNQIFKRHLSLCSKHKQLHQPEKEKKAVVQKNKKCRSKNDDRSRAAQEEGKKVERRTMSERGKRKEGETGKADPPETETRRKKEGKGRSGSKIPVLVSSQSTSSSPDRDLERKEKPGRPKARLRREREGEAAPNPPTDVETTQILEITHAGAELTLQKPQAVIHPSQAPLDLPPPPPLLIPPLVSTLRIPPFRQTWNKPLAPMRRSPIAKFRQRFEVIPEEKSSSLSSAEEKNGREALPHFADASTSPLPPEKIHFESYNVSDVPNLIVAKITNKHLDTLPYVSNSDSQKIILFSSKPRTSTSSKGRDALIAMNREDFNRLAKGWMNFYKLNENMDNSETEGRGKEGEKGESSRRGRKGPGSSGPQEKKAVSTRESNATTEVKSEGVGELDENIRFDCSNTILRVGKGLGGESGRGSKREWWEGRGVEGEGGKGEGKAEEKGEEETDSDSTDYMEPPSPRVPPLSIDDIPSDATLSSTDSDLEPPKPHTTAQPLKHLPPKRRSTTNRTRPNDNPPETSRCGKKKNSGWSVTVAGTVELSRSAPDLEMRLSFPGGGGPPVVSQSDSGFAEEPSYSKASESVRELEAFTSRQEVVMGQGKQKWMVTVKNPKSGDAEERRKSSHRLPQLEPTRNPKNVLKDTQLEDKVKRLVERKMQAIWPKVQKVIRKEFLTDSGRLITELDDGLEDSCLSVRGSAVSLERKQRPPTMTERDVTRRHSSRGGDATPEGPSPREGGPPN